MNFENVNFVLNFVSIEWLWGGKGVVVLTIGVVFLVVLVVIFKLF